MTSKVSRAAMAAGIACGVCALSAIPAQAADTLYWVPNPPAVSGATALTPQSATLSGTIDTGGDAGGLFTLPAKGAFPWSGGLTVANTTSSNETFSSEGIPVNDSNTNAMVNGGAPSAGLMDVSNAGQDNFSDVEFEYDTLKDYTASGNQPGPDTQYATEVDVPTTTGISAVSTSIGAFGVNAQNNTGNTPLNSNTTYVYWIVDQPGATDQAQSVNVFNPNDTNAAKELNPNYECLPDSYINANAYLKTLTATGTVKGGVTSTGTAQTTAQSEIQGSCVYFYGNLSGNDYYDSPTGEFTTPKLGKLSISGVAKVTAVLKKKKIVSVKKVTVQVTDKSNFKASGTIELDDSNGNTLATGSFGMKPNKSESVKLKLTGAGVKAVKKHQSGALTLTSNWDQPTVTKKIKL